MKLKKIGGNTGQEEMVGFVLIVILVLVIGIVFLGISLKKPSSNIEKESLLVSSFLGSLSSYTSDCQIPESIYRSLGDLITDCYNNEACSDGRTSCQVLDKTLGDILNSSFLVESGSYTRYYQMTIKVNNTNQDIIQPKFRGNPAEPCPSAKLSNQRIFSTGSSGERIVMSFELCNNA